MISWHRSTAPGWDDHDERAHLLCSVDGRLADLAAPSHGRSGSDHPMRNSGRPHQPAQDGWMFQENGWRMVGEWLENGLMFLFFWLNLNRGDHSSESMIFTSSHWWINLDSWIQRDDLRYLRKIGVKSVRKHTLICHGNIIQKSISVYFYWVFLSISAGRGTQMKTYFGVYCGGRNCGKLALIFSSWMCLVTKSAFINWFSWENLRWKP